VRLAFAGRLGEPWESEWLLREPVDRRMDLAELRHAIYMTVDPNRWPSVLSELVASPGTLLTRADSNPLVLTSNSPHGWRVTEHGRLQDMPANPSGRATAPWLPVPVNGQIHVILSEVDEVPVRCMVSDKPNS
jgi:hypothetical protein